MKNLFIRLSLVMWMTSDIFFILSLTLFPSFKGLQWGNARQMFFFSSHVASLRFVGKIHDESSSRSFALTDFQYFLFVLRQSDCRLTANIRLRCCHEFKKRHALGIVQQVVVIIESCLSVSNQTSYGSSILELFAISLIWNFNFSRTTWPGPGYKKRATSSTTTNHK